MWKALVNLVNRWSYRCDHKYELIEERNILDREMYNNGIEISTRTEHIYFCNKCGDSKKIS